MPAKWGNPELSAMVFCVVDQLRARHARRRPRTWIAEREGAPQSKRPRRYGLRPLRRGRATGR
eukprot:9512501-Alexandrium_andersonii.AAC.1